MSNMSNPLPELAFSPRNIKSSYNSMRPTRSKKTVNEWDKDDDAFGGRKSKVVLYR